MNYDLDAIITALCRENQRATYSAVADLIGEKCYRGMGRRMNQRGRSECNRWVVRKDTGFPSEYSEEELSPPFPGENPPIETGEELRVWLEQHKK